MNNTITALQNLYAELGGELTDTYEAIANGNPVSDYNVIPDMIDAIAEISGGTIELPKVTNSDNGDVLGVVNGKWAKAEPPSSLPETTSDDNSKVLTVVDGQWNKADVPKELPPVTATDNDSTLSVVNGAWAKKAPSNEYTKIYDNSTTADVNNVTIPLDKAYDEYVIAFNYPYLTDDGDALPVFASSDCLEVKLGNNSVSIPKTPLTSLYQSDIITIKKLSGIIYLTEYVASEIQDDGFAIGKSFLQAETANQIKISCFDSAKIKSGVNIIVWAK